MYIHNISAEKSIIVKGLLHIYILVNKANYKMILKLHSVWCLFNVFCCIKQRLHWRPVR